jgi:hypothetical protein
MQLHRTIGLLKSLLRQAHIARTVFDKQNLDWPTSFRH